MLWLSVHLLQSAVPLRPSSIPASSLMGWESFSACWSYTWGDETSGWSHVSVLHCSEDAQTSKDSVKAPRLFMHRCQNLCCILLWCTESSGIVSIPITCSSNVIFTFVSSVPLILCTRVLLKYFLFPDMLGLTKCQETLSVIPDVSAARSSLQKEALLD